MLWFPEILNEKPLHNNMFKKIKEYFKFWWVFTNLNDLPGNRKGSPFFYGSLILNILSLRFHFEWCLKSRSCGSYLKFEPFDDGDITFHVSFPPISLYFTVDGAIPKSNIMLKLNNRKTGWSIHNWKLWVSLWENVMEWNSTDPKWWSFSICIDPRIWLFGDTVYKQNIIENRIVSVPMPEKCYDVNITLSEDVWYHKRTKWLNKKLLRAHCTMKEPIPHPGKGTDSWNCGLDGLYGLTTTATTFEEAIGKIVETVLTKRRRYPL